MSNQEHNDNVPQDIGQGASTLDNSKHQGDAEHPKWILRLRQEAVSKAVKRISQLRASHVVNPECPTTPIALVDSGADISLAGKGWLVTKTHKHKVHITGVAGGSKTFEIVNAVALLLDNATGEPVAVLVLNQAVHDPTTSESLLAVDQLENNGVQDFSRAKRWGGDQCLKGPDFTIPLIFDGTKKYFKLATPTRAQLLEYNSHGKAYVHELTSENEYFSQVYNRAMAFRLTYECRINNLELRWTDEKLAEWQKRFAFHSKTAVKQTFLATTQRYKSVAYENQMFPTRSWESRFPALRSRRLQETVYTDTFEWKSRGKKLQYQLFVAGKSRFVKVYRLTQRIHVPTAIAEFFADVGVPDPSNGHVVWFDRAQEQVQVKVIRLMKEKYHVLFHTNEANHPNQNRAERFNQEVKKRSEKLLSIYGGHERSDYCLCSYVPDAMNYVAKKPLRWKCAFECLFGYTPDISVFRFRWWQPIWYLEADAPFLERMRPGFYLCIARDVGDEFCYSVQPCWTEKDKLPIVLHRGVVLPRYPGETFHGALPRLPSSYWFPAVLDRQSGGEIAELKDPLPKKPSQIPSNTVSAPAGDPVSVGEDSTSASNVSGVAQVASSAPDDEGQKAPNLPATNEPPSKPIAETEDANWTEEAALLVGDEESVSTVDVPEEDDLDPPHEEPASYDPGELEGDQIDPEYANDINNELSNELQDQGIGGRNSNTPFSTEVDIRGHVLKHGKLTFEVKFGHAVQPVKVEFADLRQDVPHMVADYVIRHNIGARSRDPNNRPYLTWAKSFLRHLKRAALNIEATMGYECAFLRRLRASGEANVEPREVNNKKKRKFTHSPNNRSNNQMGRTKYGVLVPKNVEHALQLDLLNGDTLWREAITKEVQALIDMEVFKFEDELSEPINRRIYQFAPLRMIFDVKQDLRRKARLVIGGHVVDATGYDTYASNMKGISARLLMLIADANDFEVRTGDIANAYLNAKTAERVYTRCGPEFEGILINNVKVSKAGQLAIIHKALYGLASSAKQWHKHLADTLRSKKFVPTRFDPDVWYRPNTSGNGYDYIGTHTDDIMVVGSKGTPDKIFKDLQGHYTIKKIGEPTHHLGCDYHKQGLPVDDPDSGIVGQLMKKDRIAREKKLHAKAVANPKDSVTSTSEVASDEAVAEPGVHEEGGGPGSKGEVGTTLEEPKKTKVFWYIGTKTYVQRGLEKCAEALGLSSPNQFRHYDTPMMKGERPEEDQSELLDQGAHTVYQQILGIGIWLVICGRYDIAYAINVMSKFNAAPRRGLLERVIRILGYLRKHPSLWIKIDSSDPGIVPGEDPHIFGKISEMKELYPDVKEDIDPNFPQPKGKEMATTIFFDAGLGDQATQGRGHSGILTFVGRTPVACVSKRQSTAEASTYGAEFIAGRLAAEEALTIRYALRSFGVPVTRPTKFYGDNLGMLQSSGNASAQIKKRHLSTAFHFVREQVASGVVQPVKVHTNDNVADTLTKPLDATLFRKHNEVLFQKPDEPELARDLKRLKIWYPSSA